MSGLMLKVMPAVETRDDITSYTTAVYDNMVHTGLILDVALSDITETAEGTAALTFTIQGKDPGSSAWVDLLASSTLDEEATSVHLVVDPRAAASANASARTIVPRQWRVSVTLADVDSVTAVFSYTLVP